MERCFEIDVDTLYAHFPVICGESDVLGIIGEVLSRISQLDPGERVVITCYDSEKPEDGD